jgi:hypothetical protein
MPQRPRQRSCTSAARRLSAGWTLCSRRRHDTQLRHTVVEVDIDGDMMTPGTPPIPREIAAALANLINMAGPVLGVQRKDVILMRASPAHHSRRPERHAVRTPAADDRWMITLMNSSTDGNGGRGLHLRSAGGRHAAGRR